MSSRYKKILSLKNALELAIGSESLIVTSSLKRSVDMNAYSKKVAGLFFHYLADEIKSFVENHKKVLEQLEKDFTLDIDRDIDWKNISIKISITPSEDRESLTISYEEYVPSLFTNNYKQFFPQSFAHNKRRQFFKPTTIAYVKKNGVIRTVNKETMSIFSDEEKKLLLGTSQTFNINIYDENNYSSTSSSAENRIGKIIIYNINTFYSIYNPNILLEAIREIYSLIIELISHESTHTQQFNLGVESKGLIYDAGGYPKDIFGLGTILDKNILKSKNRKKSIDWVKNELKHIDVHYDQPDYYDQFEKILRYYKNKREIEAFIREFRAQLRITRLNFAKAFCKEVASKFSKPDVVLELWEEYKKTYRGLNYPEKDLGNDSDALFCVEEESA